MSRTLLCSREQILFLKRSILVTSTSGCRLRPLLESLSLVPFRFGRLKAVFSLKLSICITSNALRERVVKGRAMVNFFDPCVTYCL